MNASNVVITGMGIVSCIGWSPKEVYDSIRLNKRGFRPISCLESPAYRGILAGEVDGDPAARSGLMRGSRSDHLAVYAARQAFDDANLSELLEDDRAEVGVVLGITTGGLSTTEVYLESLLKQGTADIELMRFHECSTSAATIAHQLELFGVQTSVSNACASGANALALARDYIQSGEAEIVLAGGVDSLTRLTVNGFNSLLVYDAQGCRPFDKDRAGMTIGEGAGILVLESEEHARERGAKIRARLTGACSSCDAYHVTSPAPDGIAILKAMRGALEDAGRLPEHVDYVNAHGTGTRENDASESAALTSLFGENMPFVSSTKGFCGHTLAAAGAIEAVISILALERGLAPSNLGLDEVDPEISLTPIQDSIESNLSVVMSNSIGFGGNNCALIFEKGD